MPFCTVFFGLFLLIFHCKTIVPVLNDLIISTEHTFWMYINDFKKRINFLGYKTNNHKSVGGNFELPKYVF
jgi:hypothetical protein